MFASPSLSCAAPSMHSDLSLPSLRRLASFLLVFLASPHFPPSRAQNHSPLSGQGLAPHPTLLPPPNHQEHPADGDGRREDGGGMCASPWGGEARVAYTPVFVSVVLNKLLAVDDERYQFEAIFHIRMSWHDPRAPSEIRRRTEETFLAGQPSACARVCAKGSSLCCDALWLPGVMGGNLLSLEDERTEWEAIALLPGNETNVRWGRRLRATFHAALRFRRYPFDTQQLVVELWAESCCYSFVPSASAIRLPRSSLSHALHPPLNPSRPLHNPSTPSPPSPPSSRPSASRSSVVSRVTPSRPSSCPFPSPSPPPPTPTARRRIGKGWWGRKETKESKEKKTTSAGGERRGRVRREDGRDPDDLSGWQVESVEVQAQATQTGRMVEWVDEPHEEEIYNMRLEEFAGVTSGGGGAAGGATRWGVGGEGDGGTEEGEGEGAGGERVGSGEWLLWQQQQQQMAVSSLNSTLLIVIRVQRIWHYYLFLFLLPTFLAVALSWTSFCVSPEHLELRVGTGITLFLALTSHQFIIFDNLPHSSYVTIMGWFVIWSYALIVAAVLQSLLVNYVYSLGETAARERNESQAARATRRLLMGPAGALGRWAAGSGGSSRSRNVARFTSNSRWHSLSPQVLSMLWRPSASVVAAAAEPLLAQEGGMVVGEGGGGGFGEGVRDSAVGRRGSGDRREGGQEGVSEGREESQVLMLDSMLGTVDGSPSKGVWRGASVGMRGSGSLRDRPASPVLRRCKSQNQLMDSDGRAVSRQASEHEGEAEADGEKRAEGAETVREGGLSHLSKRIQRTVAQASQLKGMVEQDPHRAKIVISRLDGLCLVLMPLLYVGGLLWIYMVVE